MFKYILEHSGTFDKAEAGLCRPPVPPVRTGYMDGQTSRFYEEDLVYYGNAVQCSAVQCIAVQRRCSAVFIVQCMARTGSEGAKLIRLDLILSWCKTRSHLSGDLKWRSHWTPPHSKCILSSETTEVGVCFFQENVWRQFSLKYILSMFDMNLSGVADAHVAHRRWH